MALRSFSRTCVREGKRAVIRIGICGAAGRMGKTLIAACDQAAELAFSAALERPGAACIGMDAGEIAGIGPRGVKVTADLQEFLQHLDVAVDFSHPEASNRHAVACAQEKKRMVIGTTGLSDEQKQALSDAARLIAIVFAPNMSVGVNLCLKLLETTAQVLGDEFDVEILEAHHRQKIDAPSGTALRMGEVVAKALGRKLPDCAVYGRQGLIGERDSKTIGFSTVRAGEILGEHTVMFAGAGECIEFVHKVSSRQTFASGALRAARWVIQREQGLFDMQDVLGLR